MEVVILDSPERIGALAADLVEEQVRRRPDAVLGLATGSSPLTIYDELAGRVAAGTLSLARCSAFLLDEYVGLPADHPQRYRNVIDEVFVSRVNIDPARVHGPDGLASDLRSACHDYDAAITGAGGVDVQILGVGTNGHIAFNEPGPAFEPRTHVRRLTSRTRRDNARFFGAGEQVPEACLTQGVATIMEARRLVLVATGHAKAEAVQQLVEGPISPAWPASILQVHPHATVIIDRAAAGRLAGPALLSA